MNKDTYDMLARLQQTLIGSLPTPMQHGITYNNQAREDAAALRKISMTLSRWHELECGDGNEYGSWAIVRGNKTRPQSGLAHGERATFEHDDDGKPFIEHHHYLHGKGKDYITYTAIADREAGAKRRLARIMANYPGLIAYIQTDPRGCALYILKASDVPAGGDVSAYYSRGVAVFK